MEYRATIDRAKVLFNRCNEMQRNQGGYSPSLFTGSRGMEGSMIAMNSPNRLHAASGQPDTVTDTQGLLLPSRLSNTATAFPEGANNPRGQQPADGNQGCSPVHAPINGPPRAGSPIPPVPQGLRIENIQQFLQPQNNSNPFLQPTGAFVRLNEVRENAHPINQCRDLIFEFERKLTLFKNIEYDIYFLKSCVHHQIVPQGLRCYRFPNGITRNSDIFVNLCKLFNDTGLATLNLLINHNQTRLDNLRNELQLLQATVLGHHDFESFRHLFDRIVPKITRHVATLIFRKQRKLDRDLAQYRQNSAYLLNGERVPRNGLLQTPQGSGQGSYSTSTGQHLPPPLPPQAPPGVNAPPPGFAPTEPGAPPAPRMQPYPEAMHNQEEQPFLWHGNGAGGRRGGRGRTRGRGNRQYWTGGRMTTRSMTARPY